MTEARDDSIPLEGPDVALVRIAPDSHQFLYFLATTQNGWRWRYRGAIPSIETFVAQPDAEVLLHFVVLKREPIERVGYVVGYSPDFRSLHACYGALFSPGSTGRGFGGEATTLFTDYLFPTWSLRTIYTELPDAMLAA